MTRIALLRPPGPQLGLAAPPGSMVDLERACAQHMAFRSTLEGLGLGVAALAPVPEAPRGCFVGESALVLSEGVVLARPAGREAERAAAEVALAAAGSLARITPPAILDAGDVVACDDLLHVGQSPCTDHAGLKQLAHLVLAWGLRVKAIAVTGCARLRSACTSLGGDRLLVHADWIDARRLVAHELVAVDAREPHGAGVLVLGDDVVVAASAPRTAERLARLGLRVHPVELDELEKAGGNPATLAWIRDLQANTPPTP